MVASTLTLAVGVGHEAGGGVVPVGVGVGEPGGVLVVDVAPRSPADDSDLRPGDVVMQVGTEHIETERDLRRAYDASGPSVLVRICRGGTAVALSTCANTDTGGPSNGGRPVSSSYRITPSE